MNKYIIILVFDKLYINWKFTSSQLPNIFTYLSSQYHLNIIILTYSVTIYIHRIYETIIIIEGMLVKTPKGHFIHGRTIT